MAFKPVSALSELARAMQQTAAPQRQEKSKSFDQLLGNRAQGTSSAKEAYKLAEIMRLQMMSGILHWDDGSENPLDLDTSLEKYLAAMPDGRGQNTRLRSEIRHQEPNVSVSAPTATNDSTGIDRLIEKAARRFQLEPALIKAVIKAESGFDHQAISSAGAQGLMQLMPATAKELGVENSFDPEQNIMGGSRYLKDLLNRYEGDLNSALAAYNWGMGNLERSEGSLPEETRNYQNKVKKYLAEFHKQTNSASS